MEEYGDNRTCNGCSSLLMEPYIQCAECPVTPHGKVVLCLHCFAKGVEFTNHHSDHGYSVVKNNFPLFERHWTAMEEMQLVNAVAECGYGNWVDIAQQVRTKGHTECERHYNHCYMENPQKDLPVFQENNQTYFPSPIVFKLSEDPPRPAEGSSLCTEMAGYMAGRGDFTTEYENFAEVDLRHLRFDAEEDKDPVELELKLTVVDIYRKCLKDRQRRKRIIRKYGLININKINQHVNKRYDRTIRHYLDSLRVFARLLQPDQYQILLESLHYEYELKNDIKNLQECHENQVTQLRNIKMFRMLKSKRDKEKCQRHLLSDVLHHLKDETACQSWLQRQVALDTITKGVPVNLPLAPRRAAPPLDISGLPGQDRLTAKEKTLCSSIRLVPEAYMEFKNVLINECRKQGCLKLAQARLLIKIDVNKTRKIYDFLEQEGMINKDPL